MNRYSTLLLAAGLALCGVVSSCVDDTVIKQDMGDPIGFLTDVNRQSRSSLIHTTENLDSFHVYAYCPDGTVFFENLHVQKVDPDRIEDNYYQLSWEIEGGPYFYPRDAAWVDYYVYRYISGIEGGTTPNYIYNNGGSREKLDVTAQRQMIHEFRPYDRLESQEDLIIEHRRSYNNEVSGVELHFHHALTQVELKAYAPNNNVRVVVAGAWFCNIINRGDVYWPNMNPQLPNNGYGKADDQLYWILPDRLNWNISDPVETAWSKHTDDYKWNEWKNFSWDLDGANAEKKIVRNEYRSHYGTFFNKPIVLGFSPNDAPEGYEKTDLLAETKPNPDTDPIANPSNPLHDCTDYNGDGVCDHWFDPNASHTDPYVSRLLTVRSDDRAPTLDVLDVKEQVQHLTNFPRPLNVMVAPQQLTGYNKNRDEDASLMFYDEDGKKSNKGAYILLAIQVYSVHGTEDHMHRHLIFPYNGPEKWDVYGNMISDGGDIIDFLGNKLDSEGWPIANGSVEEIAEQLANGTAVYYDEEGHEITDATLIAGHRLFNSNGEPIDNFGNLLNADGKPLDQNGRPLEENYSYQYVTSGEGDPTFRWNRTFGWVCIPIDDLWEPGHKYTYILEFMGKNSGAGIYPPDDFDFTELADANGILPHSDEVRGAHWLLSNGDPDAYGEKDERGIYKRPWISDTYGPDQSKAYIEGNIDAEGNVVNGLGYTILSTQEVRLRDPGTMNSRHRWVGKKQGDPVLSKPIDFKVTVDEWLNDEDWKLNMEDHSTSSTGNGGKK